MLGIGVFEQYKEQIWYSCKGCVVLQIIKLLYYLITYLYLHIVAL